MFNVHTFLTSADVSLPSSTLFTIRDDEHTFSYLLTIFYAISTLSMTRTQSRAS
jgi:hypothetical protein